MTHNLQMPDFTREKYAVKTTLDYYLQGMSGFESLPSTTLGKLLQLSRLPWPYL